MRVLSKPEIDHAILLNELNLVLENFGIQRMEEGENEALQEEAEKKRQKQTKRRQIKTFVHENSSAEGQEVYVVLRAMLERFGGSVEAVMAAMGDRRFEQLVKSKKKEVKVELIRMHDFIEVVKLHTQIDIGEVANGLIVEVMQQLVQLDAKYADVWQLKNIQQLLEEVMQRYMLEE